MKAQRVAHRVPPAPEKTRPHHFRIGIGCFCGYTAGYSKSKETLQTMIQQGDFQIPDSKETFAHRFEKKKKKTRGTQLLEAQSNESEVQQSNQTRRQLFALGLQSLATFRQKNRIRTISVDSVGWPISPKRARWESLVNGGGVLSCPLVAFGLGTGNRKSGE